MDEMISRRKAIDAMCEACSDWCDEGVCKKVSAIQKLPSADPEQSPEIQDILNYLDTVLHPIISPEHWEVYSELHDMISSLPSAQPESRREWYMKGYREAQDAAQPEIVRCRDCKYWREHKYAKETQRYIPFCGFNAIYTKSDDFCSKGTRRTE